MAKVVQYKKVAEAIASDLGGKRQEAGFKLPAVRDLAKRHGVSIFTISKALDLLENRGIIQRRWAVGCFVADAAKPKPKSKLPPVIGILLDPQRRPAEGWSVSVSEGIRAAILAEGARATYVSWHDGYSPALELDGLVVSSDNVDDSRGSGQGDAILKWLKTAAENRFPVVTVDFDLPSVSSVQIDNASGAYQAARYLLHLGHRRIAYMHTAGAEASDERLEGLKKALKESGVPFEAGLVWACKPSAKAAHQLFPAFHAESRCTAICCFEDFGATGVVKAAQEMGLKVPGDLSVVGYGNLPMGEFAAQSLTTVDVNPQDMTARAISLLLRMIQTGDRSVSKIRTPTQLIVRETSGPLTA